MNLLVRADAGSVIGTGHIMRCMALAQAWREAGGEVTFACAQASPAVIARLRADRISVVPVTEPAGSAEDAAQTQALAQGLNCKWIVADGYQFGAEFQRIARQAGSRLLFVDDYGHAEHYYADAVLNQNIYAAPELYSNKETSSRLLLGPKFVLLRREFRRWIGHERFLRANARKVLVTMGGSDPENATLTIIRALQKLRIEDLDVVIVAGALNPHLPQLIDTIEKSQTAMTLKTDVSDMSDLMLWADVAVSAAGSTIWELLFMGLPTMAVILADNQSGIAERLDELDMVRNLGWIQELQDSRKVSNTMREFISNSKWQQQMCALGQACIDGEGAQRVTEVLRTEAY